MTIFLAGIKVDTCATFDPAQVTEREPGLTRESWRGGRRGPVNCKFLPDPTGCESCSRHTDPAHAGGCFWTLRVDARSPGIRVQSEPVHQIGLERFAEDLADCQ